MTTEIFFQNLTPQDFELKDLDNNQYGFILAGRAYSLKLNFSSTFEKQYNLIFMQLNGQTTFLSFWLNINGEIARAKANDHPFNMIVEFENCRSRIFNKLIIAPQGSVFLRGCSQLLRFPHCPESQFPLCSESLFFDFPRI